MDEEEFGLTYFQLVDLSRHGTQSKTYQDSDRDKLVKYLSREVRGWSHLGFGFVCLSFIIGVWCVVLSVLLCLHGININIHH